MSNYEEKLPVNPAQGTETISRRDSIKGRLRRYFLWISFAIIFTTSTLSMVYSYITTKQEATGMLRNKMLLAQVFLENEKSETASLAQRLAGDRAVQLGLQLESSSRLKDYLANVKTEGRKLSIEIFNGAGEPLIVSHKITPQEQTLITNALGGNSGTDSVYTMLAGEETPAYFVACPVFYGKDIIGVVAVRFIFKENKEFFINLSKNLECELAVYTKAEPVISTSNLSIDKKTYNDASHDTALFEKISLTSGGLNEYASIMDKSGTSCGLLHLYISSVPYLRKFATALGIFLLSAVIIMLLVIFLVIRVSNSIIKPIEILLQGVNVVRNGNLKHEIELDLHDEIGRLGTAFNEMRSQLDEKITTIIDMNSSLEEKVKERTATIDKLNENMKHYLSPQLYASIAGGERDASTMRHYRKKLTVFFSDVANFTATTESLEPEDLSTLLNSYLDNMAQIAEKYGGTIDKYVGDAVMVFFGDPIFTNDKDHALRAVRMAMEMQQFMIKFRREWQNRGIANPFHVRVGINTGYCTIGNFGSDMKMDYTIIGNNVNMAARFEAAAKPDTILMSPDTYALVKNEIECVEAGTYTLKGISEPVKGYMPVGIKNESKVAFAEITDNKELVFPEIPVDLANLDKSEKRNLLLAIKDIFDKVKNL